MFIFLSFLSGITLFYIFRFFPVMTSTIFFSTTIFLLYKKKYTVLPVIIISFLYAFLRFVPPIDTADLSSREIIINCLVQSSRRELSSGGFINEVSVISASDADTGEMFNDLKNKEISIISDEGLTSQVNYKVLTKTGKDIERHNPGTPKSDRLYVYLKDIISAQKVTSKGFSVPGWFQDSRDRLNKYLMGNFSGDSGALLASITTGERTAMSEDLRDAFSATGLSHLLSISGTHFGLFSMLIFWTFRFIVISLPYRFLQRFTVYLTPSQAAAMISLPFMVMYLLISGSSIPALRSFIMINLFLFGLLIGRKGFWLNSLLFAAFLICVWEPPAILNLSFQLSFLAVLFIGLSLGDRKKVTEGQNLPEGSAEKIGISSRVIEVLKGSVLLTLTVSLGTAPLVAYYFHYFSIVSPVANLLITPFIGFILVPLSLVSSFIFIFSGYYPLKSLVAFTSGLAIKGVKLAASVPFADIKIPAFPLIAIAVFYSGLFVYLLFSWGKTGARKKYALIFPVISSVIFLSSLIPGKNSMSVTFLDVGQGDSAVIESAGSTIAIDTGRTGRELGAYLKYLGKRNIDALILTHADADHSAGAAYVAGRLKVKELWDNGLIMYPDDILKNMTVRQLERGDEIIGYGLRIQVFHPYKGFYTFEDNEAFSENNSSLVLKITGRKKSFLFTADTAEEAEEDMLHLGKWLKSDVLKVSHHGSRTSSADYFLKAVSPDIAVISVGRFNPYGHPHRDTIERLQGMKIYRTDRDGAIKFIETQDALTAKTYRDFQFERVRHLSAEWRNIKRLFMRW